jgi:dipeptidyl aminopeptidase/acylaminoacyl peptidase
LAAIDKWQMASGQVGIWGHSNGGQIALVALEVTEKDYPTVLWAPVSAPFPYSVLYYTYDYEDGGKQMRNKLAEFEVDYDVELFNPVFYLGRIRAPVLWQQGTADPDVPVRWARDAVRNLQGVEYVEYPGADHNLIPVWNRVVSEDIEFFGEHW